MGLSSFRITDEGHKARKRKQEKKAIRKSYAHFKNLSCILDQLSELSRLNTRNHPTLCRVRIRPCKAQPFKFHWVDFLVSWFQYPNTMLSYEFKANILWSSSQFLHWSTFACKCLSYISMSCFGFYIYSKCTFQCNPWMWFF